MIDFGYRFILPDECSVYDWFSYICETNSIQNIHNIGLAPILLTIIGWTYLFPNDNNLNVFFQLIQSSIKW